MSIFERVEKLRDLMAERNIEAYIVPTSDPHQSEYLADFYKSRQYISGFTGSAGTAVITMDKAGLWTDGRYFIQAEDELKNSPFKLYKMGEDINYIEFLKEEVSEFGKVGVDGRVLSLELYNHINKEIGSRLLVTNSDLISDIWTDRPALDQSQLWILDDKYTGKSYQDKVEELRATMKKKEIDYTFIGALEDIAYLFNLRASDIYATPVFFAYAVVSQNQSYLFIKEEKLDYQVKEYLRVNQIEVYDYDFIFDFMNKIPGTKTVFLDPSRTNVDVYEKLNKNVRLSKGTNLTTIMKMIKTDTEIEHAKNAFHKDAIALTKFFNWLEAGVKSGNIDEVFASNKLLDYRKEQDGFLEVSFETISAYGPNAAMPHYDPNKVVPATLQTKGLYLVDSGGQYLDGTTDITRTIALGELTEEEKIDYTLTMKAHIAGMTAKFKKGNTGAYVDAIVRYPLYRVGKDFNHGTGHGVGFILGVHEGPMSISRRDQGYALQEGMVFSIEPGIYAAGSHGIRLENIVFVKKAEEKDFLELESLLYLPLDTRPIVKEMLDQWEIDWLNDYNKKSFEALKDELNADEVKYLEKISKEI